MPEMLVPGSTLQNGAYTLENCVGSGVLGRVYRARDAAGAEVAIKECFPAHKTAFLAQAAALQTLSHPHLVRCLDVWEENDTAYFAMPFLPGPTLLEKIETSRIGEDDAVQWLVELAEGVAAIHEAGLLHLDIKPENVLWDGEKWVLVDFDLLQKQESAGFQTRPLPLELRCGTPGYAPLEQYSQRVPLTPASDIYALGATFFHLLTAQAPLPALDRAAGLLLFEPSEKRPELAPHLSEAIACALALEPLARPQSVGEWLALVRDEGEEAPPAFVAPEGWFRVALQSPTPRWPRRCACCFARSQTEFMAAAGGKKWPLPLCEHCRRHHRAIQKGAQVTFWGILASLLVAFAGLGVALGTESLWPLLLGPFGIIVNFAAMTYGAQKNSHADEDLKPSCTAASETLDYRFNGKIHIFRFRNARFAAEFRRQNSEILA